MKKLLTVLMFVGVLAVALWALPIQAEMVSVGDSELSAISGKADGLSGNANDNLNTGAGSLTLLIDGGNGDIQLGYYQWNDNHSTDASDNKGGNNQSGSASVVQQNVTALTNAISWGAYAAGVYTAGDGTSADVDQEAWATLFIGGF
jgi:hypothetical protein